MLTTIIITDAKLRDALVSFVSGARQTHSDEGVIFYQKNSYIFAFSDTLPVREIFEKTLSEYQSEKFFFAEMGFSIDTEHEIGDVILPNAFFSFDKNIVETEIDENNRDNFLGDAKFLEIFSEQKDYFVEDFGLSVGGIVVENTPNNPDYNEKLMMAYGADVYSEKNLTKIAEIIAENLVPSMLVLGVMDGKKPKNFAKTPEQFVAENIMTTIRLVNGEENL